MLSDQNRSQDIASFLEAADWVAAETNWLAQDASTRRYARLTRPNGETAILMDAPGVEDQPCAPDMSPEQRHKAGWNATTRLASSRVDAFVLIAEHLQACGLRSPRIYHFDTDLGLALLEDFGVNREFARLIERGAASEVDLYRRAASQLADLHACPVPATLTKSGLAWPILEFDRVALRANADLFFEWLPQHDTRMKLKPGDEGRWHTAVEDLIQRAEDMPRQFTLRDYHAENLVLLPEGEIGLLDFQDAVIGWDAWDMAMLVQDARREVSEAAYTAAIQSFLIQSGANEADFLERLAVIGTLNALRITGLFARLQKRDGKLRYAQFMPRQQKLLAENLKHPTTHAMASFVEDVAPFLFAEAV